MSGGEAPEPVAETAAATAVVRRTDLAAREQFGGTLGYAGDYQIVHPGLPGVLTSAPSPGAVVQRGQALYEVEGHPVSLLYGVRPVWRDLGLGMTPGDDVRQLNDNLVAMGHLVSDPGRRFSWATHEAVRRWQQSLHVDRSGWLRLGSIVFAPHALRITQNPTPVGSRVGGGPAIRASSTRQVITVALPTARRGSVAVGSPVLVTVPGSPPAPATVTEVGQVATIASDPGAQATVAITVGLTATGSAAGLDQVPVQVSITTTQRKGVLAVPVTALTAASSGYELTILDAGNSRKIAVRPGLFDEQSGLIEVTGEGLDEGMTVEAPA